jgi:hypothetical protein
MVPDPFLHSTKERSMNKEEIKKLVWQVAVDTASNGPGWAQEGVVLRAVGDRVSAKKRDIKAEQLILEAWHDLFFEKKLSWGYDLDNPNSPFFHVRELAGANL